MLYRCPANPLLCFLPSLRVNLDMGKIVYSWVIRRDSKIPGTVVRSSTIPEQLGRISYLLTDKTGERLCRSREGPPGIPVSSLWRWEPWQQLPSSLLDEERGCSVPVV